ncbi:hypothetical protein [Streptosporangium subroseum]|uniref:hypothetical protein n=1 Tax=Streptosporangium subroseum TaxID=106412 RepID=UPI0030868A78|nr:hypothetical protein OHB15_14685 [Streptosporangium subroseum]
MPRFIRRFPTALGITLLLASTTLTACGEKEPTAAEAGKTLKVHILKLLEERGAQNVQVTDPGGKDIFCGNDKAKQTYAAVGQDAAPERAPDTLNSAMLGALKRVAHYETEASSNSMIRVTNESTRTILILESSINGQYSVRGETECLNQS